MYVTAVLRAPAPPEANHRIQTSRRGMRSQAQQRRGQQPLSGAWSSLLPSETCAQSRGLRGLPSSPESLWSDKTMVRQGRRAYTRPRQQEGALKGAVPLCPWPSTPAQFVHVIRHYTQQSVTSSTNDTELSSAQRPQDAALYNFGRVYSGPNFFTDVKSNVAILAVYNGEAQELYSGYAVSGDRNCPGVQLTAGAFFDAIEATDGLGETYSRTFDAEFKLLTDFASQHTAERWGDWKACGHAVLWSKKPLCESCHAVVHKQFPRRYPNIVLEVIVGDEAEAKADSAPVPDPADGHATCDHMA